MNTSRTLGSPQRVIIPKGVVDPHETTIVEISQDLAGNESVVVQASHNGSKSGSSQGGSSPMKLVKKTSVLKKSFNCAPGGNDSSFTIERYRMNDPIIGVQQYKEINDSHVSYGGFDPSIVSSPKGYYDSSGGAPSGSIGTVSDFSSDNNKSRPKRCNDSTRNDFLSGSLSPRAPPPRRQLRPGEIPTPPPRPQTLRPWGTSL